MLFGGRKFSYQKKKNSENYQHSCIQIPPFLFFFCLKTVLWNYNSPLLHSAEAFLPYLKLLENPRVQSKIVKSKHQVKKREEKSNNFWWNQMQLFNFFNYLGWSIFNSNILPWNTVSRIIKILSKQIFQIQIIGLSVLFSFTMYTHGHTHPDTETTHKFITGNSWYIYLYISVKHENLLCTNS